MMKILSVWTDGEKKDFDAKRKKTTQERPMCYCSPFGRWAARSLWSCWRDPTLYTLSAFLPVAPGSGSDLAGGVGAESQPASTTAAPRKANMTDRCKPVDRSLIIIIVEEILPSE
jgi:hypothetical protein